VSYRWTYLNWCNLIALAVAQVLLLPTLTPTVVLADQSSGSANISVPSPQASTLSTSGASGGAVSLTNWLPLSLEIGSFEAGPLTLRPTLNIQFDGFREVNTGWGGSYSPPIQESKQFYEQSNEEGLDSTLNLDRFGTMFARVSGIFAATGGGLNPRGTNYGEIQTDNYSIEDAYLKWTSGDLFPTLGQDAVQIIGGRYTYRIGDGFLFYNGAKGGGNRTDPWTAPHHAFAQSGIFRLDSHHIRIEGFYLSPSDFPKTNTRLAGVNLEYRLSTPSAPALPTPISFTPTRPAGKGST